MYAWIGAIVVIIVLIWWYQSRGEPFMNDRESYVMQKGHNLAADGSPMTYGKFRRAVPDTNPVEYYKVRTAVARDRAS